MDKDALIERFWDLIECGDEGYARAIILLLAAMPEDNLRELVTAMDQIGAHCKKCGAPCDRDSEFCDDCEP
jgi:hypothetical protein